MSTRMSNELYQLAGFFWRYRETGGTVSAEDAGRISAELSMLAEGVAQQGNALQSISAEFDRYIEDQVSDAARPMSRGTADLTVIDGVRC